MVIYRFQSIEIKKIKTILLLYGLIVVLGSVFTFVKYNVVRSPGLTFMELFDKLVIVYAVTGIIMVFFILFSFLGKLKMEKDLE
ncbi:MAG: hypothetical protein U9R49_13675 [Bacteroidota bacterium]|nr:hypothetical protein [Bacteroidota bacterium]